ncbi:MAG: nucleotidyltransferase family protein [Gammaproteobacteria bacterium]
MKQAVTNLAGILLAAGGATRFGSPKVLARYRGEPLIRHGVRLLAPRCGAGVFVVVGAAADSARTLLDGEPATLVENPDWAQGMSTSIARGIASLPATADAALILLGDQPAITNTDLDALIDGWHVEPALIAAAGFNGQLGPPVIMPREYWPQLAALHGDQGARSLLGWHAERTTVPIPNAAYDVDTPEDLAWLEARPAQ